MKIGLVSPYCGGNLGDGAIHSSVIQAIRSRVPDAEIVLLSLGPQRTTELHGLPSFPVAFSCLEYYGVDMSSVEASSADASEPGPVEAGASEAGAADACAWAPPGGGEVEGRLRAWLKSIPGVRWFVVGLRDACTSRLRIGRSILRDVVHTVHAYRFARSADLIVVAGGGQIDDYWGGAWGHPWTLLRWALVSHLARRRFVVASVGVASLDAGLSRIFTKWMLELADYRSYRDAGSRDLLQWTGLARSDPVVPDLAFAFRAARAGDAPAGSPPIVAVSPIAHLSPHYWPRRDAEAFGRYLDTMQTFVWSLLHRGFEVALYTTSSSDRHVVEAIRARLAEDADLQPALTRLSVLSIHSPEELSRFYAGVDYVVASRLHAVILAHVVGVPVLAISYDRKVTAHMADMRQEAHCLAFDGLDAGEVAAAFDRLRESELEIRKELAILRDAKMWAVDAQFERILGSTSSALGGPVAHGLTK